MKKFLAIYTGSQKAMKSWETLSSEEKLKRHKAGMAAWTKWMKQNSTVIVDVGGPLGTTKRTDAKGVKDITNTIAAYTLIKAKSHQAAANLFKRHPHFTYFPGDSVEIMECLPIPTDTLDDAILKYEGRQQEKYALICKKLRETISSAMPNATAKMYHNLPVWFIGENAVVGYRVTAKNGVTLLFWNGQALKESGLKAVGSFKAAQIQYQDISEIDTQCLRRWLRKARVKIWDFASLRRKC